MPNVNFKHKSINGAVLRHSIAHSGIHPYVTSTEAGRTGATTDSPDSKTPQLSKSISKISTLDAVDSDKTINTKVVPRSTEDAIKPQDTSLATQPSILEENFDVEPSLRCGVLVHSLADGYAARANNIWSYLELNRTVGLHNNQIIFRIISILSFVDSEESTPFYRRSPLRSRSEVVCLIRQYYRSIHKSRRTILYQTKCYRAALRDWQERQDRCMRFVGSLHN